MGIYSRRLPVSEVYHADVLATPRLNSPRSPRPLSCKDTGRLSLWRHANCLRGGGWNGRDAPSCRRLASSVMADEVVSYAFSHGFHPQHVERLAAYWAEALGGPSAYSDSYGDETTVVKMHSGNGEHHEMDRRAIAW